VRSCADDVYCQHDEAAHLLDVGTSDPLSDGTWTKTDGMTRAELSEKLIATKTSNMPPGVERYAEPLPIMFMDELFHFLKEYPDKMIWLDLKDGPYDIAYVESCCWSAFVESCCCCTRLNHEAHPLTVRVVEAMSKLSPSERGRVIVSSTNPFLVIGWMKLARQHSWTDEVLGYGFDYGNTKNFLERIRPRMCLENLFSTTSISMVSENRNCTDWLCPMPGGAVSTTTTNTAT
jgi:hypothetical protein